MEEYKSIPDIFREKGWDIGTGPMDLAKKGQWEIYFDTSSWLIIEHKNNPLLFHLPAAFDDSYNYWFVNLVEHLCKMEDERHRLRNALKRIGKVTDSPQISDIAEKALSKCYHNWLGVRDDDRFIYCPICGKRKKNPYKK